MFHTQVLVICNVYNMSTEIQFLGIHMTALVASELVRTCIRATRIYPADWWRCTAINSYMNDQALLESLSSGRSRSRVILAHALGVDRTMELGAEADTTAACS